MTILVTGGGGFVMSNLVKRWLLVNPGEHAIVVDVLPFDADLQRFFGSQSSRIDWRTGDVLDRELCRCLTGNTDIKYLVHGAAATSILRHVHSASRGDPGLAGARNGISVNIDGTLNVLEVAASLPNLERMVHVSSGSVYGADGPSERPLREHESVEPEGLYGISKFTGEAFCSFCADELDLPVHVVRLSGVYGPMDRVTPSRDVQCAPNIIARKGLNGETIRIRSLEAVGDFINAEDVASAIVNLLLAESLNHQVYNVAAGETATIRGLVELAIKKIPTLKTEVGNLENLDIDYDPTRSLGRWGAYDISKIRRDTGWEPRTLREAFHSYLDWVREFESLVSNGQPTPASQ